MKPSFALNLTEEGVSLLHRTARGWLDVGRVAFDDTDLPASLDYLRSTALGLAPKGLMSKVVIPNSQILYLEVNAPGSDKATKEAQIAAALEGRTPYEVGDLAFDWTGDGPTVTVAVVARETLAEAEAFATEHRFNPVSFVAIPPENFPKEPFFGISDLAPTVLTKNQKIEPDVDPIVILTREMPKAEAASDAPPEAEAEQTAAQETPEAEVPKADATAVEAIAIEAPAVEAPSADAGSDTAVQTLETGPELGADPAPTPQEPDSPPVAADEPAAPAAQDPAPIEPEALAKTEPSPPVTDPEPLAQPFSQPTQTTAVETAPKSSPPSASNPVAAAGLPLGQAEPDEAPMAVDVPIDDLPAAPPKPSVLTADLDDVPAAPSSAILMAFNSRRGGEQEASGQKSAQAPRLSASPTLGASVTAPTVPRPAGAKPIIERPAAATRPAPKFSYDDPVPPPPRLPGDPPAASVGMMGKAGKGLRSLGTLVSAPTMPGARRKSDPTPVPPAPIAPAITVASPTATAATLAPTQTKPPVATSAKVTRLSDVERPGSKAKPALAQPDALARGLTARGVAQRGKPRFLGLIMTGILLLLLALVAAWSSFFLAQNDNTVVDDTVIASANTGTETSADPIPAPDEEMLADLEAEADQDPAVVTPEATDTALITAPDAVETDLAAPETAVPDVALAEPAPAEDDRTQAAAAEPAVPAAPEQEATAEVVPEPQPAPLPEPAPQTGVEAQAAVSAQPGIEGQDEIFLAGMDAPPAFSDPLVLTAPAAVGDVLPGPQMPPPPFGTVYQFDENGMIRPTASGITTPEGVLLIAGKPPVLPPTRPAAIAAAAASAAPAPAPVEVATPVATPATDLTPEETFAADPALRDARPRVRPAGLAPSAAPAGGEDDASLAPAEGSRFASLRPRERPQAILAAGEVARRESEAASLAVQAAAAAAAQAVVAEQQAQSANQSALAVSVSRVPAPRPRDLSKAVEAAVATATRQSEPRVTAKAAEPSHEEADNEPEVVASAAPRIPTRANVAKQATFVNAINLSKTNLIGVYGTQSKRYALIRQSNGRYKKVRVGDTVDGGKVQAITSNEVRYQKGGRLISLAMPKT